MGDRDFAIEFVFACSLSCLHLSRLAEELVVWSSTEFGYVKWRNDLATGSSLMPNKKNPDLAELVRGATSQPVGDLIALLMLIKGCPQATSATCKKISNPSGVLRLDPINLNAMAEAFRKFVSTVSKWKRRSPMILSQQSLRIFWSIADIHSGMPTVSFQRLRQKRERLMAHFVKLQMRCRLTNLLL